MVATSFGLLGVIDDYLKIKRNNSRGISIMGENYFSNYAFNNCCIVINEIWR